MNRPLFLVLAFVAVLAASPATAQPTELPDGGPTSVAVAGGAQLLFRGGNGDVLITKAPGDQALITVARSAAASDVHVVVVPHAKGVTICAVYPSKDPKKPNECLADGKGRVSQGNPKDLPEVRMKIEVPSEVNIDASIGFGNMRAESVEGDVTLYSNRGSLAVIDSGAGTIHAGVGLLGNIDALVAKTTRGGPLRLVRFEAAGSGRIRVALPLSLTVTYQVATNSTPTIDPAFKFGKTTGGVLSGSLGPSAVSDVRLSVDTGIAGSFVLRPAGK